MHLVMRILQLLSASAVGIWPWQVWDIPKEAIQKTYISPGKVLIHIYE